MQTAGAVDSRGKAVFVAVVIAVSALVAALSAAYVSPRPQPNAAPAGTGSFSTYAQLEAFVAANAKSATQYVRQGTWFLGPGLGVGVIRVKVNGDFAALAAAPSTAAAPSYTGTNVQVQGVDEPDRVKTDGTHLFVSNGASVSIINAYPPNGTAALSTIRFGSTTVLGLEIAQGRLLIIGQRSSNASYVDMLLYDTTDLAAPRLTENFSVAGSYVAARMAQGFAYLVVQQPAYRFPTSGNATGLLPVAVENGRASVLAPQAVHYTFNRAQVSYYTIVASMDVATGATSKLAVLTGPSSVIYASAASIYVVYADYTDYYADNIPGDVWTGGVISAPVTQQGENSTVVRVAYSAGAMAVAAAGSVPGTVLNQFSMDEYGGYFRIATSRYATISGTSTRSNDVYVLGSNLTQASALRNIAPGENIYAVRFVGETGYVVTYQQIDPLFVISFKDPTAPVIQSALKVSGYSDYLHPLPGGYLIGVGKDSVPSSTGNFSYYLGVKLSLFRVFANGTSVQVSRYLIGDRGTESPVLTDHLAFTYDPTRNVTVIPVLLAKVSGNQSAYQDPPPFGDYVWQGVYVLKVTPQGFKLLGTVTQYPPGQGYGDSPDGSLQIDRSVVIGGYLYTLSQKMVMVTSLADFSTVASLKLPA